MHTGSLPTGVIRIVSWEVGILIYMVIWCSVEAYNRTTNTYNCNSIWLSVLIVALAASCILAVISFEGFEKWYLHLSLTNIGVLVVTLFLLNVIVINKDDILDRVHLRTNSNRDIVTSNMTVDDAIRLNYQWTVRDYVNFYTPTCKYAGTKNSERWCRHTVGKIFVMWTTVLHYISGPSRLRQV